MEKGTTEVYLVGDGETVTGFSLAGLKNTHDIDEEGPELVFRELSGKKGIIMVTSGAAKRLGEYLGRLEKTAVVCVLPDEGGTGDETVNRLIRKAIGFDIRK